MKNKSLGQSLIGAASAGRINVMRELLQQNDIDINFQDDEKNLPLWTNAFLGVEHWTDIDPPLPRTGKSGNTALMWACHLHRPKVAEALLDAGADPKITNLVGENVLHLIDMESQHLVDRMIAAGADVNAQTAWGVTPLMIAVMNCNPEVAVKLLEHGADPLLRAWNGLTAFGVVMAEESDESNLRRRMQQAVEDQKRAAAAELEKHFHAAVEAKLHKLRKAKPQANPIRIVPKPKQ